MSSAAKRAVVAGELHKIVKRYGVVDGKNRKIYKSYAVVGGVNRLIYMSENFAFTGAYTVSLVEIDSTKYDLYKLTTSGILSIYADDALFWMCGGGAGGVSATSAYSGAGGAGAFCTSGELSSGKYPVEIGKGGAADTDGAATTLGTYTAAGGKTGVGANGGNGGSGGGGGDSSSGDSARYGVGGTGDGVSKYPFGLTSLFAHCAGGGGGTNYYSQAAYIRGGEGGTNGGDGKDGNNPGTSLMYALGGEKGGGNGGQSGGWGSDATFYGSAGGGGGKATKSAYGKGGSGYQGVVYIAIPHKETIEPIVIIRQPQSVTALVGDTVTFAVDASGTGLTYQWQWRASSTAAWRNTSVAGNQTDTITMDATTTQNGYQYRCTIYDVNGNIMHSDVVTLTVLIDSVEAPQNVKATSVDGNSIRVTWDAVEHAIGYRIHRSLTYSGGYSLVMTIEDGATAEWIDTGLTTGTTYYYYMRAIAPTGTLSGNSYKTSATPNGG